MKKLLLLVVLILGISTAQAQTGLETKLTQEYFNLQYLVAVSDTTFGTDNFNTQQIVSATMSIVLIFGNLPITMDPGITTPNLTGINTTTDIQNYLGGYLATASANSEILLNFVPRTRRSQQPAIQFFILNYINSIAFAAYYTAS